MPERQGQGREPWDRPFSGPIASSNGTGKQKAFPQRPRSMTRIDSPPQTPRVGRPQRQAPPPRTWQRRLLLLGAVFLGCGLLAGLIGYAIVNYFIGIGASAGASNTASDFLVNLSNQDYAQAYKDLDATITLQISPEDFKMRAQKDDRCYGTVESNYSEVEGSATSQDNGNTQSYTYTITRTKSRPYPLPLTLHKDNYGNWYITNYGSSSGNTNDLAPGLPACS